MKNIGLLISELNSGGAERVVSRLSTILNDEYNVFVILFEDTYIAYEYSGKLINLDVPSKPGVSKVQLLIRRIKSLRKKKIELGLDCCISFLDSPNMVNILAKYSKCKTIISIRNYSEMENAKSLLGQITNGLYKMLYKKADCIIPVTKVIERSYIQHYRIDSCKIHTIYNPYDISEIQQFMKCDTDVDFSKYKDQFIFVTVGRQMHQKGYWHLLKAFHQVLEYDHNCVLLMVGDIDPKVEKLMNDLGLQNHVVLVGKKDNPFSILAKADTYILSSLFEGFPNAMVEAMACGIPVIAADCKSGPREILAPKTGITQVCADIECAEYGILTKPFEAKENWDISNITDAEQSMARAMKMLMENVDLRQHYAKQALIRANDFSYEKCKESFVKLIEDKK